jgi:hypothetical protein
MLRPTWRNFVGSVSQIMNIPPGAELWYDDRDIPFLQEDVKDAADIQSVQAQSIKALIDIGWDPDSVVDAIIANDFGRLKGNHTGLPSVQLQPGPPGQTPTQTPPPQPPNGNGVAVLASTNGRSERDG